jgi:2-keto-4-pentenoate hydratase
VAAIDAVIPSIEIISPRFKALPTSQISTVIADFCANGGAVFGRICTDWRKLDLVSRGVSLSLNGIKRREGKGALVLGNPLNTVEWLINALGEHGASIEKGQFILAGTLTGIHTAEVNHISQADFGDLGTVDVVFEDEKKAQDNS